MCIGESISPAVLPNYVNTNYLCDSSKPGIEIDCAFGRPIRPYSCLAQTGDYESSAGICFFKTPYWLKSPLGKVAIVGSWIGYRFLLTFM